MVLTSMRFFFENYSKAAMEILAYEVTTTILGPWTVKSWMEEEGELEMTEAQERKTLLVVIVANVGEVFGFVFAPLSCSITTI